MATPDEPNPATPRPPEDARTDAERHSAPRRRPLFPVIAVVLAVIVAVVVFNATRSAPNYDEEQRTPDAVEEAD